MRRDKGFIGLLVLIIVALALLKYFFDFSIFEALNSPKGREVAGYVKEILNYLKELLMRLINYIR